MKRILFAFLATCSFSLFAATWTDPETNITWTYTVSNGEATIGTGSYETAAISTNTTGAIVIPATLGGAPVKGLAAYAFYDCGKLTSITIPDSVVSIGGHAFERCGGLVSITIPKGVTSISGNAFYMCGELTDVKLPETLTSVGDYAFSVCKKLTKVIIPESVTSIGNYSFYDTYSYPRRSYIKTAVFLGKPPSTGISAGFAGAQIYYRKKYASDWERFRASAYEGGIGGATGYPAFSSGTRWVCFDDIQVIPLFEGGTTEVISGNYLPGEPITIKATSAEGYIFLGWSSNVPGIGGRTETLTFTLEDEVSLTLIASFFPKAVLTTLVNETLESSLDEKVDARIEAKIDGESLLTAEQAATKTSATIEAKVADGELITSDQLQVMAMDAPVIAVADGVAKVGVSLKRAASLEGEWEQVEAEEAEITDEGAISVSVPADEKAAFYKFVVPEKQ